MRSIRAFFALFILAFASPIMADHKKAGKSGPTVSPSPTDKPSMAPSDGQTSSSANASSRKSSKKAGGSSRGSLTSSISEAETENARGANASGATDFQVTGQTTLTIGAIISLVHYIY